jgi:predicted amidophosphoribosyltransferase
MSREYKKCSGGSGTCTAMDSLHSDHAVHCYACGAPLEKWVRECEKCKLVLGMADKFCTQCGRPSIERKLPWQTKS